MEEGIYGTKLTEERKKLLTDYSTNTSVKYIGTICNVYKDQKGT